MTNIDSSDDNKIYNESIKQIEEQAQQEQETNIYTCECCDVKFKNGLGFEYYISNGKTDKNGKETGMGDSKLWVVYDGALFNESWIYFLHKPFATYGDFTSYITYNYNLKPTYPEDESNIWTHLYNKHINPNIPLDAKMYEEYIF